MNAEHFSDDDSDDAEGSSPGINVRPKWQLRFSSGDSEYAQGYMPLGSVGETLWRTPTGASFTVFETDQDEPARTSRLLASLVHRLRSDSGMDFQINTKQAILLWTDFEPLGEPQEGKRVVNKPCHRTRTVIICNMIKNPAYDAWVEKTAAEAAAASLEPKRPPGRPPKPKPKPEVEIEKRPRGRPRKNPPPDSGQLDLE